MRPQLTSCSIALYFILLRSLSLELAWPQVPEIIFLSSPQHCGYRYTRCYIQGSCLFLFVFVCLLCVCLFLTWVLGIQAQVLMLVQQAVLHPAPYGHRERRLGFVFNILNSLVSCWLNCDCYHQSHVSCGEGGRPQIRTETVSDAT